MIKKKILFFARYGDIRSKKILTLLKKKFNYVKVCWSEFKGQKIPSNIYTDSYDFIISYRSYFILKDRLLNKAKLAINFHPGPPDFRGIGCLNFALLNNSSKYGATCHLINNRIDSGKIIKSVFFKIKKNSSLKSVLYKTHAEMFKLAKDVISNINDKKYIKKCIKKSKKYKWSKKYYKQSNLDEIYKLNLDYSKNQMKNILRATLYKHYYPYFVINKEEIFLKKNYEKI